MAKITVCDVCSKQPAKNLQVPIGRSFDGVESSTDYKYVDLCLDHALMIAKCALGKLPEEARAAVLDKPEAPRW